MRHQRALKTFAGDLEARRHTCVYNVSSELTGTAFTTWELIELVFCVQKESGERVSQLGFNVDGQNAVTVRARDRQVHVHGAVTVDGNCLARARPAHEVT